MDENATSPQDLEAAIGGLSGVRAARVVTDNQGDITEIHVVSGGQKSPKSLVRDIQTLAQAQFRIAIDHRTVSVAEFADEPIGPTTSRHELRAISWTIDGNGASCQVELDTGSGGSAGKAEGAATTTSRLRLAADATTSAIEHAAGGARSLEVVDVQVTDVGRAAVAVALVNILSGPNEQAVTGIALVRTDESEAVARAVLDAYNKRAAG